MNHAQSVIDWVVKLILLVLALASLSLGGGEPSADGGRDAQSPEAIVFERDGDLFAIAADGSRTVRLTRTPVRDELYPAVSPDGRSIAYSRRQDFGWSTLWTMSVDGGQRLRLTRGHDFDPAWSPDGQVIYFSRFLTQSAKGPGYDFHEDCGSISRIGTDGRGFQRLTNPPSKDSFHSHHDPSVSPDGLRIAFTDANQCSGGTTSYALRVIDTRGRITSDLARLTGNAYYPVPPEYENPTWSPDGREIAFESNGVILIADRDGTNRRRVAPAGRISSDPAWSGDGRWVAFVAEPSASRRDAFKYDLYVVRTDGTGLRRLTRTRANESSPAWLPQMPTR